MKILMISPDQHDRFNWGWQLFRDEINWQHEAVEDEASADIVLFGDPKYLMKNNYSGFEKPKICIMGDYVDYYPDNRRYYLDRNNTFIDKNKIDVAFFMTRDSLELFKSEQGLGRVNGKTIGLLNGYSVDTNIFKPLNLTRDIDVAMISNEASEWCYPHRKEIKKMLTNQKKWNVLIGDKRKGPIHRDYVIALNRSKIFINSCNRFKNFSWKVHEAMACGTFLLTDRADDMLGYTEYEIEIYESLDDLKDFIEFWLGKSDLRENKALQGMEYCRVHHSNEVRVKEMFQKLEEVL